MKAAALAGGTWLLVSASATAAPISPLTAELCQAARMLLADARELAPPNAPLASLEGVDCAPPSPREGRLTVALDARSASCEAWPNRIVCGADFLGNIASGDPGEPSPAMLFVVAHELGHVAAGDEDRSAFSSAMLVEDESTGQPCGAVWGLARHYPEAIRREQAADRFALRLLRRAFAREPYANFAAPSAGLWSLGAQIRKAFETEGQRVDTDTWPVPAESVRYDAERQVCAIAAGQASTPAYELPGTHPDWASRAVLIAAELAPAPQSDAPAESPRGEALQQALSGFDGIDRFMLQAEASALLELRTALSAAADRCLAGELTCPPIPPLAIGDATGCEPLDVEWDAAAIELPLQERPPDERAAVAGPMASTGDIVLTVQRDTLWAVGPRRVLVLSLPCAPTAIATLGQRIVAQCPGWEGLLDLDLTGSGRHLVPRPTDGETVFLLQPAGIHAVDQTLVASYATAGPAYMLEIPAGGSPEPFPPTGTSGCEEVQQAGAAFPWRADDGALWIASVGDASVQVCGESDAGFHCTDPFDSVLEQWSGQDQDLDALAEQPMPEPFLACGPAPDGKPLCLDTALRLHPVDRSIAGLGVPYETPEPIVLEQADPGIGPWCRADGKSWLLIHDDARSLVLRLQRETLRLAGVFGRGASLACSDAGALVHDGEHPETLP